MLDYLIQIRNTLMDEIQLPDFKGRHLYLTQLRLVIFAFHWVIFLFLYPELWDQLPYLPLIFNLGFLATAICYALIISTRFVISISIIEVFIDVISQTIIIYVLGVENLVAILLLYGFYVIAAGAFFGYLTALVTTVIVIACYATLVNLFNAGYLEVFIMPDRVTSFLETEKVGSVLNLFTLAGVLGIVVYASRIVHRISLIKQRALERRHLQLMALNRIGSTIRGAMSSDLVIKQVISSVTEGLGFDLCIVGKISKDKNKFYFYVDEENQDIQFIESRWGYQFSDLSFDLNTKGNFAFETILKKNMIIRNELNEVTRGMEPPLSSSKAFHIQDNAGFKKFVLMPLIVEDEVIGALIGASRLGFIEESIIDTLDNFANQTALAIESSGLIDQLKNKNLQLEKANQVKSDFLSMMTHELRTPLNAVIGYSEILLDQDVGKLNEDQEKYLKEVLKSSQSLLELINNILDLAKMESGKLELHLSVFSWQDLMEDIHHMLIPLFDKKALKFQSNLDQDLPLIEADYSMVKQIFLNLIGNAIKYTSNGGMIEVEVNYYEELTAKNLEDFIFPIDHLPTEKVFCFKVVDNGVGMSKSDLSQIFEAFHQVDSPLTREHQGTGLGLTLSLQMMELHQGILGVKSELNKGTSFLGILPII
jgi:signal transduction histidine kinase